MPKPSLLRRVLPVAGLFAAVSGLSSTGTAQHELTAPFQVSSLANERVRAFADFDGDGRRDLVVTQLSVQLAMTTFWVAFGAGNGNFAPGPNQPVLPTGWQGDGYVLAGDVTGDGLPDIVMGYRSPSGPAGSGFVMYRNLGGGTFAAPLLTLAGGAHWIQNSGGLSDWNGDGVFELVTSNAIVGGSDIRRWTWQAGVFVGGNTVTMPDYTNEIAIGDVTGDGLPDVVVGCEVDNRVFIVPTLPGGGLGAVATIFVGPGSSSSVVPSCGDVDGDGDQDIVVGWPTYQSGSNLAIVTNNGGVLSVGQPQFFTLQPGGNWSGRAHVADLDGDGDGDVVIAHEVMCALENVGGTLQARGAQRLEAYTSGPTPFGHEGVGFADFDGDQRPDFVGAHTIAFGTGRFDNDAFGAILDSTRLAVDDDDDGDLDILELNGVRRENRGSEGWVTQTNRLPPTSPPFFYGGVLAAADFSGDGRLDLLVTYRQTLTYPFTQLLGTHLLEGRADGSLFDRGLASPAGVALGDGESLNFLQRDLDGDGDVDVTALNGWWENNGTGMFTVFHGDWTGSPRQLADVNGDGRLDVLTHTFPGTATEHWLFVAQATGGYVGQLLFSGAVAQVFPRGTLADVDDDGDVDFVVGSPAGPTVEIRTNQGGVFAPPISLASRDHAFEVILVDDFDRDGMTDLAAASGSSWGAPALVWRRTGPGTYAAPRSYVTSTPLLGNPADLDGDGDPDLYGRDNLTRSGRFSGVEAGRYAQYGTSVAGASGVGPILGVRGPVRSNSTIDIRLRRAPGASFAALDFGLAPANVPDVPLPGLTLRVAPLILLVLGTPGNPNVPGSGLADLPIAAPPGLLGQKFYLQAFTLDGNTFGGSNGLELVFGL